MTRQIHDLFSKEYLTEIARPLGQVGVNLELAAETYHADWSFIPAPTTPATAFESLGLLERLLRHSCLLEYFWQPPTATEIRTCLLKLFTWQGQLRRQAKQDHQSLTDDRLPRLWILTTSASETLLTNCLVTLKLSDWGPGVYFWGETVKTAFVVIDRVCLNK